MSRYRIVIDAEPDGGAYNVSVPVLSGCFTWGETLDEATLLARTAIETHIAALRDLGEEIQEEGESLAVITVEIDLPNA